MAFRNDVDDLVEFLLTPFSDMVSKARDAADNAGDEDPSMRKAADALAREGMRALNRLEPLCKNICNQHGSAFVKVIKTNEDISNFHMHLTDLLWGFDDYIAVDTFDEAKYAELQASCRNAAPKMYNILVRSNIELLSKMSDSDSVLHIVPESPPISPMYPMSPSSYTWQAENKTDVEPPLLRHAPWGRTSASFFNMGSHSGQSKLGRGSQANTIYSGSAPGLEYTAEDSHRQSYSSGDSSGSSASQSSRSVVRQSIMSTRRKDNSPTISQPLPFSERLSPLDAHETYHLPRNSPRNLPRISTQDLSPHGTLASRGQPPAKAVPPTPVTRLPSKNCAIDEFSSFLQYKGFCSGAREILKGGSGVKEKQKPVHRTLSRVVAKCAGCAWELDYNHIENDRSNRESGNMTKRDVSFRLRFLQKSHLAVKRPEERLYACVFCVQSSHTLEESDATVFFMAEDLFAHLARHPRPLPIIPGVTVLYGTDVPSHLVNNYDLQFKVPAKPNPIHRDSKEIAAQPTGVAMKEVRRDASRRSIVVDRDRPEELQVAVGGRLTGIKWPTQYKGRRVFAWHDGNYASVPWEIVMLNTPGGNALNRTVRSAVSAKAKWKFSPKHGKMGWLRFDKGDTITNIGWTHPDHWCWCGTTRKGEWGVFPQAFIDPNTVEDLTFHASSLV